MFISLFVYLTVFFFMIFMAYVYKNHRGQYGKLILFGTSLVYSLIIGRRFNVGVDYGNYRLYFIHPQFMDKMETWWLSSSLKSMGFNYSSFFIVIAFLQIIIFLMAFKGKRSIIIFAVFFFFTTLEFFLSMNVMRQVLAWCIFLYSVNFIEKRQLWKFLFCIIFAMLFHRSAIVLLPFYFLPQKIILSRHILLLIYVGLFFIGISFQNYISNILGLIAGFIGYSAYGENMESIMEMIDFSKHDSLGVATLIWFILDCTVIVYSEKLIEIYRKNGFVIYYYLFFIGICLNCICEGTILDRATMYFLPFKIVVYSYLMHFMLRDKRIYQKIYVYSTILILFVFFISSGIIGGASGCYPFRFIP